MRNQRVKPATKDKSLPLTAEMRDLMRRRTMPFLDVIGLQTVPIAHILQEAYLQGLSDACDAFEHRDSMLSAAEGKK